jgi:SSS family solute:Na+ symporter
MTLYQRIYATRDERTAKRAWFLAGLLEWPLMAFLGVALGMFARVLFPEAEAEMGLPLLIKNVLPVAVAGLVVAAYFSAILSTADSCLLASAGNFVNDLYQKQISPNANQRQVLRISRTAVLFLGASSIAIALTIPRVLDAILLSYSFMVSGLFIPTIAGLHWRRVSPTAALWSMLLGGGSAIFFSVAPSLNPLDEPILLSLPISLVALTAATFVRPETRDLSFMTEEKP